MRHGRVSLLQQRIGPPGVRAFAFISAFDAVVRGTMLSVYPLLMYRAWGDAAVVSLWYFGFTCEIVTTCAASSIAAYPPACGQL